MKFYDFGIFEKKSESFPSDFKTKALCIQTFEYLVSFLK